MPSRRQALASLAALPLAGLSACEEPVPALRVGSIVFPGYEFLFLARELQLLAHRDVRLVEMRSNTDCMRALAARQLEAAALTLDELLAARADGVDLRAVLVLDVSAGADVLLARPPLHSLAGLKGARIGVEDSAGGALMLSAALQAAGLQVSDIQKVPVTLDRTAEHYGAGRVDAVVTAEPWARRLEAQGAVRLFDSKRIPGRIVDVLAAHADTLERHAHALRRLVAGHFAAQENFRKHPLDAARLMAPRLQIAAADLPEALRGLHLPDAAENRSLLGAGGTLGASLKALQELMLQQMLLARPVPLDSLLDDRFLPAA